MMTRRGVGWATPQWSMLCSRHVSLSFSTFVLFVLFLLCSHVLVLFLSFVVCVSPSCVVCVWAWAFAVVVVAAQAPSSKVVSWLFFSPHFGSNPQ